VMDVMRICDIGDYSDKQFWSTLFSRRWIVQSNQLSQSGALRDRGEAVDWLSAQHKCFCRDLMFANILIDQKKGAGVCPVRFSTIGGFDATQPVI
jgi:hypothetical protein